MTPNEEEKTVEEMEEEEATSKKEKKKLAKLEEELEKAKADVEHWKNEYYRAYADTKNLRNSLERDHKEALKYRAEGFIEDLLPILDSFHMALGNEPTDPALKNYLSKSRRICPQFSFDPSIHNPFQPLSKRR